MARFADLDALRAAPDAAFIARMRREFQVEREIDHVLTGKLERRRSQRGYTPLALADLIAATGALIRSEIGDAFALSRAQWLPGGSSKLQMAFDLAWTAPGTTERATSRMVLRMEPPEAIVETSRRREFEMLRAMRGIVPVPPIHWVDAEARFLPYPALIYGYADGITFPKERPGQRVRGVGTNFSPEQRSALSAQFVAHLAAIHAAPVAQESLRYFDPAAVGSNASIVRQVNWWRRVWEEDRPEAVPLVEVAARWLIDNAPPLDHVSIVHGDYRAGNFLFDEASTTITAWLDWELAVLGDRHQDLTWSTGEAMSRYAEDGVTLLASGLLPREELFERYEALSGLPVDPVRLRYFRIFNSFTSVVHMLATAWRVSNYGKTHQDVMVAWASIVGNVIAGNLRDMLEELA